MYIYTYLWYCSSGGSTFSSLSDFEIAFNREGLRMQKRHRSRRSPTHNCPYMEKLCVVAHCKYRIRGKLLHDDKLKVMRWISWSLYIPGPLYIPLPAPVYLLYLLYLPLHLSNRYMFIFYYIYAYVPRSSSLSIIYASISRSPCTLCLQYGLPAHHHLMQRAMIVVLDVHNY